MQRLAIFTDASRVDVEEGQYVTAFGWLAFNMDHEEGPFCIPSVKHVSEYSNSTMHAELSAVWDAAHTFSHHEEVHIFTDSLYTVRHGSDPARHEDNTRRPLRVYPSRLRQLSLMENINLHHVRAHKSNFYNELVDKMVGFVTRGEMSIEEAEAWARGVFRKGILEVTIAKGFKPKYVKKAHERNSAIFAQV